METANFYETVKAAHHNTALSLKIRNASLNTFEHIAAVAGHITTLHMLNSEW
jgi:hypothetical protein